MKDNKLFKVAYVFGSRGEFDYDIVFGVKNGNLDCIIEGIKNKIKKDYIEEGIEEEYDEWVSSGELELMENEDEKGKINYVIDSEENYYLIVREDSKFFNEERFGEIGDVMIF